MSLLSIMSTVMSPPSGRSSDEGRKRQVLEAALEVFLRFGFRKTSMDEVARAAQISRQGLYLHFSTKEELFRAAFRFAVDSALGDAKVALGASLPIAERLVRAFDEWVGRYVGGLGPFAADLAEASDA